MNIRIQPLLAALMCVGLVACSGKKTKTPDAPPVVTDDNGGNLQGNTGNTIGTAPIGGRYSPEDLERDSCLRNRVIYFDLDSDVTKPMFQSSIACHAKYLRDRPGARMKLDGHTDERGSNEYNLALGERRSQSVRQAMSAMGASSAQIETVSFGEEVPTCREAGEGCWSQNRRVEINYIVP